VLVVEDDLDARDLLIVLLSRHGAEVLAVTTVREAMERLASEKPDVLLSDISLPREDAYALIEQLRAQPAYQQGRLPVIALTARATPEERRRTLEAGFQAYLTKPIDEMELVALISSLARQPSEEQQAS